MIGLCSIVKAHWVIPADVTEAADMLSECVLIETT